MAGLQRTDQWPSFIGISWGLYSFEPASSAEFCFDAAAPLVAYHRRSRQFTALAYAGHWDSALEFAKKSNGSSGLDDDIRFWNAVAHAGYSGDAAKESIRQLRQLGLIGLARRFAFEELRHFAVNEELPFLPNSLEQNWIQALVQYHISLSSGLDFDSALSPIAQILEAPTDDTLPSDLARIKCLTALIYFKQGEVDQASHHLEQIDTKSVSHDRHFSQRLDWLRVLVDLQAASKTPTANGRAMGSLNRYIERYPESNSYQRAKFEKFRLTIKLLPPHQALKKLVQLPANHPYFADVQFEIVNCLQRCWQEYDPGVPAIDAVTRDDYFDQLLIADRNYRRLPEIQDDRQLASISIVIDVALRAGRDRDLIDGLLTQADEIAFNSGNPRLSDFLAYYKFRAAKQFKQETQAIELAQFLSHESFEKSHRLAALAYLAGLIDRKCESASKLKPIEIYELLVQELGDSPKSLTQSKNARVAATRLIDFYLQSSGFAEQADQLNKKLIRQFPNRLDLLIQRARIAMQLNRNTEALETWRKLNRSSNAGDDVWFESKLGIIQCLSVSDSKMATKVLRQALNLAGIIPEKWRAEFETWKKKLLSSESPTVIESKYSPKNQ